jgi:uncharacterized protein (UPF0335 family)
MTNSQLKSFVERIDRLMDERKQISDDISDIFTEAKSSGYDVPALRAIIKAKREDAAKRQAREAQIELYRNELGID